MSRNYLVQERLLCFFYKSEDQRWSGTKKQPLTSWRRAAFYQSRTLARLHFTFRGISFRSCSEPCLAEAQQDKSPYARWLVRTAGVVLECQGMFSQHLPSGVEILLSLEFCCQLNSWIADTYFSDTVNAQWRSLHGRNVKGMKWSVQNKQLQKTLQSERFRRE